MKYSIAQLLSLAFVTVFISHSSAAKTQNKIDKKVEMKCFVEVYGGIEAVHFITVKQSKLDNITKKLLGDNITVQGSGNKKFEIYRVHECVALAEPFSTIHAQSVDERTFR
jgi:hypothetical protein